jgi:hypothetical protein
MKSEVTRRARPTGAASAGASVVRRMTNAHEMRYSTAWIVFASASQARINHGRKIGRTSTFTVRD